MDRTFVNSPYDEAFHKTNRLKRKTKVSELPKRSALGRGELERVFRPATFAGLGSPEAHDCYANTQGCRSGPNEHIRKLQRASSQTTEGPRSSSSGSGGQSSEDGEVLASGSRQAQAGRRDRRTSPCRLGSRQGSRQQETPESDVLASIKSRSPAPQCPAQSENQSPETSQEVIQRLQRLLRQQPPASQELGARSFEQGRAAMSQPSTSVDQSPAVEGPSPRASFGPIAAPAAQQELLVVRPQAQPQQGSQTLDERQLLSQMVHGTLQSLMQNPADLLDPGKAGTLDFLLQKGPFETSVSTGGLVRQIRPGHASSPALSNMRLAANGLRPGPALESRQGHDPYVQQASAAAGMGAPPHCHTSEPGPRAATAAPPTSRRLADTHTPCTAKKLRAPPCDTASGKTASKRPTDRRLHVMTDSNAVAASGAPSAQPSISACGHPDAAVLHAAPPGPSDGDEDGFSQGRTHREVAVDKELSSLPAHIWSPQTNAGFSGTQYSCGQDALEPGTGADADVQGPGDAHFEEDGEGSLGSKALALHLAQEDAKLHDREAKEERESQAVLKGLEAEEAVRLAKAAAEDAANVAEVARLQKQDRQRLAAQEKADWAEALRLQREVQAEAEAQRLLRLQEEEEATRLLLQGEGAAVEAEEQARQLELCKAVAKDRLKAIEISAANDGVRKTRSRKFKA
ncbi:hypothetical protein WJX84_006227 [Apatococcus fuscideae]|uniref:Uncharacterized protein n=1 Tax=Apatococcus fuscideae TaxID=2026836 RepID=A0AAW1RIF7_9CHLO